MKKFLTTIAVIIMMSMMAGLPAPKEWTYTLNGPQVNYTVGQRVTWNGRIYECIKWDASDMAVMVPPEANPNWWAEVEE